jgi:hypothetical protein
MVHDDFYSAPNHAANDRIILASCHGTTVKRDDACRALMLGDFVGIYKQLSGAAREDGERVSPDPRLPHFRVGRRHAVRMADWRRVPLTTALIHKAIDTGGRRLCSGSQGQAACGC